MKSWNLPVSTLKVDNNFEMRIRKLETEKIKLNEKKSKLLNTYLVSLITKNDYIANLLPITGRIEIIDNDLNQLLNEQNNSNDSLLMDNKLRDIARNILIVWDKMNDEQKRFFITSSFEKIYIYKGTIEKVIFR